jgi:hypothetical protein
MPDHEDCVCLRDQLAMLALPALIDRFTQKVSSPWIKDYKITAAFKEDIEQISTMAYMIADEMRKARLKSFT